MISALSGTPAAPAVPGPTDDASVHSATGFVTHPQDVAAPLPPSPHSPGTLAGGSGGDISAYGSLPRAFQPAAYAFQPSPTAGAAGGPTSPTASYATVPQAYFGPPPPTQPAAAAAPSPQEQLRVTGHLNHAERSMATLVNMVADLGGWKPVQTHKSGAVVYSRTKLPKGEVPIFMGVGVVHGYDPQTVFTLVKSRSLWDDWYVEGHVAEMLNETTTISYMVFNPAQKVIGHRELCLVEKVEVDDVTKTIRFVTSSTEDPKVPVHPDRVRANLKLNGWILDPQTSPDGRPATRVTYVIQSDVKGLIPAGLAKRYLARRALVVVYMNSYLKKYGPPPVHQPSRASLFGLPNQGSGIPTMEYVRRASLSSRFGVLFVLIFGTSFQSNVF
ncbi:hypothetical protein DFJ73DRAFT_629632 [Zopfochytrium polystomum]|nr:hypothetical protein DFJ73DRAFT_629632 [Zopfochytrium polystomum]